MIVDVYEQFLDEINGSREYVKFAVKNKGDRDVCNMYMEMAKNEIEHASKLMGMAKRMSSGDSSYDILIKVMDRQMVEAKAFMNSVE